MAIMLIIICFSKGLSLSLLMVDKIASKKVTLSQKVDQSNSIREFVSIHMLFFNCRELH